MNSLKNNNSDNVIYNQLSFLQDKSNITENELLEKVENCALSIINFLNKKEDKSVKLSKLEKSLCDEALHTLDNTNRRNYLIHLHSMIQKKTYIEEKNNISEMEEIISINNSIEGIVKELGELKTDSSEKESLKKDLLEAVNYISNNVKKYDIGMSIIKTKLHDCFIQKDFSEGNILVVPEKKYLSSRDSVRKNLDLLKKNIFITSERFTSEAHSALCSRCTSTNKLILASSSEAMNKLMTKLTSLNEYKKKPFNDEKGIIELAKKIATEDKEIRYFINFTHPILPLNQKNKSTHGTKGVCFGTISSRLATLMVNPDISTYDDNFYLPDSLSKARYVHSRWRVARGLAKIKNQDKPHVNDQYTLFKGLNMFGLDGKKARMYMYDKKGINRSQFNQKLTEYCNSAAASEGIMINFYKDTKTAHSIGVQINESKGIYRLFDDNSGVFHCSSKKELIDALPMYIEKCYPTHNIGLDCQAVQANESYLLQQYHELQKKDGKENIEKQKEQVLFLLVNLYIQQNQRDKALKFALEAHPTSETRVKFYQEYCQEIPEEVKLINEEYRLVELYEKHRISKNFKSEKEDELLVDIVTFYTTQRVQKDRALKFALKAHQTSKARGIFYKRFRLTPDTAMKQLGYSYRSVI